jgi:hypothetical protein
MVYGGGSGRGLAPTHGFTYDHMTFIYMRAFGCFKIYIGHTYMFKCKPYEPICYMARICFYICVATVYMVIHVTIYICVWGLHLVVVSNGWNDPPLVTHSRLSAGFETVSPLFASPRSYGDPMCPSAWRLGAGGTLTVLQFAPFFGLPGAGF